METPDRTRWPAFHFPRDWRLKPLLALAVLSIPAVWAGCSIAEDYDTLSFWFDGVPTMEELEEKRVRKERLAAAEAKGPLTNVERAALLNTRVQEVYVSTHKPVEEKRCTDCHLMVAAEKSSSSGWISDLPELLLPKTELCLTCHDAPQATFTHGPAASGNCALCHQSHTSNYPHLLRMEKIDALCRACHDPNDLLDKEGHKEYETFECTACHDPHASEQEYLLHLDYPRVQQLPE